MLAAWDAHLKKNMSEVTDSCVGDVEQSFNAQSLRHFSHHSTPAWLTERGTIAEDERKGCVGMGYDRDLCSFVFESVRFARGTSRRDILELCHSACSCRRDVRRTDVTHLAIQAFSRPPSVPTSHVTQ